MDKNSLKNIYMELPDREGTTVMFRKFEEATWMFQFNKDGKMIGQVCVSQENLELIQNAPAIEVGDGKTMQTL